MLPVRANGHALQLPIDHFNSNAGTFKNRYWFNDTFYDGGPIIVQDVGEEDAGPFVTFLQEGDGVQTAVMQLAQKYKGIGIVWEHRFYGQSVPFVQVRSNSPSLARSLTTYASALQDNQVASVAKLNADQWSYHTFEQALEDVVVFANNFTLPSNATAAGRVKSADALFASKTRNSFSHKLGKDVVADLFFSVAFLGWLLSWRASRHPPNEEPRDVSNDTNSRKMPPLCRDSASSPRGLPPHPLMLK